LRFWEGFNNSGYVRFEVLAALLMKIQVFWDMPLCKLAYGYQDLGAASLIHF